MSIRATFHYFQGMECDMYSFYRIPKLLFTSEYFKNLSCEAKVLYGLMLDRMSLSIKNRWFDEEDRAYIFFSVEEIMEMLNCGRNKAVNCLKELDQEKGIGLIEKRRIGLGKTNVIYVKNFSLTEYPDEPAIFDSEETPENVAERKENTETEIEEYAKKEPEMAVLDAEAVHLPGGVVAADPLHLIAQMGQQIRQVSVFDDLHFLFCESVLFVFCHVLISSAYRFCASPTSRRHGLFRGRRAGMPPGPERGHTWRTRGNGGVNVSFLLGK